MQLRPGRPGQLATSSEADGVHQSDQTLPFGHHGSVAERSRPGGRTPTGPLSWVDAPVSIRAAPESGSLRLRLSPGCIPLRAIPNADDPIRDPQPDPSTRSAIHARGRPALAPCDADGRRDPDPRPCRRGPWDPAAEMILVAAESRKRARGAGTRELVEVGGG